MPYIGLDVGTSACKASVVDAEGRILRHARVEYEPVSPQPGYIEIDPELVWRAVREALSAVAAPDVTALSIASFGEACVMLDAADQPLARSIYYSDVRGTDEVADVLAGFDVREARAITGTRANPMFTLCKLLWTKKHCPALFERAQHIMLFGDYLGFLLTGERAIDHSLASRTMLFDIRKRVWSKEMIGAFGLDEGLFSTAVRTGEIIGQLRPSLAADLGLPEGVRVVAGGHDQILAALGGGAVRPGDSVDGMGSSECITLVLRGADWTQQMAEFNFCCEPYVFDDTYVTLAFNASSGTAIRWYRDCFEAERTAAWAREGQSSYAMLDAHCAGEPTDLLFLPHVAGSGTPALDSSVGGAMLGLRIHHDRSAVYRAVLEGICYDMRWNAELLESCGLPLGAMRVVGGGSRSDVLMQIKADVFGREVSTLEAGETGTIGLALLCAQAMGDIGDLAAEAERLAAIRKTYRPDATRTAIYDRQMAKYRKLYTACKSVMEEECV